MKQNSVNSENSFFSHEDVGKSSLYSIASFYGQFLMFDDKAETPGIDLSCYLLTVKIELQGSLIRVKNNTFHPNSKTKPYLVAWRSFPIALYNLDYETKLI